MSLYIGLMSGTSVDAVDAVLADFGSSTPRLLHSYSHPIPEALRNQVLNLFTPGTNEIDRMGVAHRLLGNLYANVVEQLLRGANISPHQVRAIGNHGQTIRHRPRLESGCAFTLQIGDNHFLAQTTGICVVGDFRSRDISVGGQGAPLVPGFHQGVFGDATVHRSVLNIGGIANISYLPATDACLGFDTGPGNGLLDAWICHHKQLAFDSKSGVNAPN